MVWTLNTYTNNTVVSHYYENKINGCSGHNFVLQSYNRSETTSANKINFLMSHAPNYKEISHCVVTYTREIHKIYKINLYNNLKQI